MKLKYSLNLCLHAVTAMLAALTLTGCTDEKYMFDDPTPTGGDFAISFSCNDMLPQYSDAATARSRATDPKTEDEKRINTIHLFFFQNDDKGGHFVEPNLNDQTFTPYQVITDATNIVTVKEDVFKQMNNITVVAIANINAVDDPEHNYFCTEWTPNGAIRKDSRDHTQGEPYEITCYDDLKKWVYHPQLRRDENRSISELPSAGMPMIGIAEGKSLIKATDNPRLEVQLRALMARVNISIKLTPNQQSTDGALPTMRVTSYGIKNMPQSVPFTEPTAKEPAGSEPTNDNYDLTKAEMNDAEYILPSPVLINKDSDPVTFSYYTYENIQLPDYDAKHPGSGTPFFPDGPGTEPDYPDGVSENNHQRWKPVMARKNASALILKGDYTNHQGMFYRAQFTIYMGENPVNDFKVGRNREYNNNISVHGLDYVRNSSDDVYSFDARVNVVTDNPLYLAMVNERKVDAHATVRPMDIWFLLREPQDDSHEDPVVDHDTTVTLEIPDDCDWISMVLIPRSEMQANNWEPGTGASKYFYEDMLTNWLNGPTVTYMDIFGNTKARKCGKKIEITCKATSTPGYNKEDDNFNMSRSRIYFYIDENVPESNNPTNYGDRICPVTLTYETSAGAHIKRTIEIEQRALVHVTGTHPSTTNTFNTWMEYYEEYLEHYDPLDKHIEPEALYEGLYWGQNLMGSRVANIAFGIDGYDVYYTEEAFTYTQAILKRKGAEALSNYTLYSQPGTAFHYCYGRNKRDSDGLVSFNKTNGWYMPGIRELEVAITQYYIDFYDYFYGNLYLSAACGKKSGTLHLTYEDTDNARATTIALDDNGKPIFNNDGSPKYVESRTGDDGAVKRDAIHRIRAFYKAE